MVLPLTPQALFPVSHQPQTGPSNTLPIPVWKSITYSILEFFIVFTVISPCPPLFFCNRMRLGEVRRSKLQSALLKHCEGSAQQLLLSTECSFGVIKLTTLSTVASSSGRMALHATPPLPF